MLLFHVGFALVLLVLITSVSLIIWSSRAEPGPGIVLAKVIGIIVFILAILDIIGMGIGIAKHKTWMHHQNKTENSCQCPEISTSLNNKPLSSNANPSVNNVNANIDNNQNPNSNINQNNGSSNTGH